MATADAQHGLYFDSPGFETSALSDSRRQEYKDLVSQVRPVLTVDTDYEGSIRFIFASGGTFAFGPGWAKGIEYVPGGRETNGAVYASEMEGKSYRQQWKGLVLTNLDYAQALPANVYLRSVDSNWFLFYQRNE